MMPRGRPAGQMTRNRQRVFEEYVLAALRGEHISLATIARRCGLHDYRKARKVVADLRKMKLI